MDVKASVPFPTNGRGGPLGYAPQPFRPADGFLQSPHVNDTACVIADVQMPGMSGIELQSHLIAQGRSVPMIFITAFPEESIRSRALKAGAVCFLSKPFDGTILIECIDIALKRHDVGTVEP